MDLEAIAERLTAIEQHLRLLRVPLPSPCLPVKEAAQVLGLSPHTVQGLINSGELRALTFRLGARKIYRIQASDLEAFIEAKKNPSAERGTEKVFAVPDWRINSKQP